MLFALASAYHRATQAFSLHSSEIATDGPLLQFISAGQLSTFMM
jgi:hypothetical protein